MFLRRESSNDCLSSQLYLQFDTILVLSQGHMLYSGPGSMAPVDHFRTSAVSGVPYYREGYNVADYLLEVASHPPVQLFSLSPQSRTRSSGSDSEAIEKERKDGSSIGSPIALNATVGRRVGAGSRLTYATTFLTQFQYLCGREWKILRRWVSLNISIFLSDVT